MERQKKGRRGNHDGCITKLEDGSYRGYITLESGKRRWFRGQREQDVRTKIRAAQRLQDEGRTPIGRDQRFDTYMKGWLDVTARQQVRESTLENYERCIERCLPDLGHIKLRTLTPQHLRLLYSKMRETGLADTTIQTTHVIIKQALQQAENDGIIPKNPARAVKVKVEHKEVDALTAEEVKQFLEANASHRLYPLWVFYFLTGVRRGEALGLTWDDVDLDARNFRIQRSLNKVAANGPVYGPPKTARSGESLPLHPDVCTWLGLHRLRQAEERRRATGWQENNLIFCTKSGRPLDPPGVWLRFQEALKRANLRPLKLHSTRHSFGSILYNQSGDIKMVQTFMRHSNIQTTGNIYTHVRPDTISKALEHLDGLTASP
jgi:integrase